VGKTVITAASIELFLAELPSAEVHSRPTARMRGQA
jgi:hypothetical protein